MDKLMLNRMEFYGFHGVIPEENKLGQKFIVDVELAVDLVQAGRTDDLQATVNYADVYHEVGRIVEGEPCQLIEAVAEKIASHLLTLYTDIKLITVRVTKPNPPFKTYFDGVTVEIQRKRD